MQDFTIKVPTQIIFGKDKEVQIGKILKDDKVKKVLLVYGSSSIKKHGLYNRVIESLGGSNITFEEFGGMKPNPRMKDVDKAASLGKEKNVDAVLGVGGGSVMDSVKAIAAAIKLDCKAVDFYTGTKITDALSIYNIVTLAATASEMNSGFVLTNEETKEKLGMGSPACFPKTSILNPELTFTVPDNYTAYSAVDIISHVIEGYLTRTSGPEIMNMFVESIIKTVIRTTEIILREPDNYEARAEFMWTATLALNGTTSSGVGGYSFPNHMIEHGISGVHDIPHGAGLSIIIPAWMKWYKDENKDQFKRFAKEVFGKESIEEGIDSLETWFRSIKAPVRLSEEKITKESFNLITEKAFKQGTLWGMAKSYPKKNILEILNLAE